MQKLNILDIQKVATVLDANNISLYDFKVNVSYDTDLANLYYSDFKEGHMNDNINLFFGNRHADYLVIFENETVANTSYYKKSQLARMTKTSLCELLDNHNMNNCGITKLQAIDELLTVSNKAYYESHYNDNSYNDLDYDFAISGYSQGDYCKVKMVGNVEKWINKDYLTNIFYDTPISGIIEIFKNGSLIDDFQLYDLANFDEYAYYDKDKLISMVADYCKDSDYKDLLVTYLNDNLNTNIDYSY